MSSIEDLQKKYSPRFRLLMMELYRDVNQYIEENGPTTLQVDTVVEVVERTNASGLAGIHPAEASLKFTVSI